MTNSFKFQHVETFNMFSIVNIPMTFPSQFMDMWRAYLRLYKNNELIECVLFEGEIID